MSWPDNYPESRTEEKTAATPTVGAAEDIKHGFKLLGRNLFSYFLAIIGVLALALLIMLIAVVSVAIFALLSLGLWQAYDLLLWLVDVITMTQGMSLVLLVVFIGAPLLGPFFMALGAVYGLSREVVESSRTSASSAFSWYRKRAISLIGGGIVHFLVTLLPVIGAFLATSYPIWNPPSDTDLTIVFILLGAWTLLINGMLSLTFPGIIDGLSAVRAAGRSVKLTCFAPRRVLTVWAAYMLIIIGLISPLVVEEVFSAVNIIPWETSHYASGVVALILFILLPALTISLTRVYMILGAKYDDTYEYGKEAP